MLSLIGFLAILGPLVVVHELGHFLFAKLFNVKAEAFSIGFGPRIWSKQIGETEWRVSAIPLGGYVKLLGEDPEAEVSVQDQMRSLQRQKAWKRFFIFFGGPLFNFLFTVVIFMAILAIGEPQIASVAGRVVRGSAAERAGFHNGDKILAINGQPMRKFEEVIQAVNDSPNKAMRFELERATGKEHSEISVTPTEQDGFSVYGEATHVGEIEGLLGNPRATTLGVSSPHSTAAKAGLKTGDQITTLNGTAVSTWEQVESMTSGLVAGSELKLGVKPAKGAESVVTLTIPASVKGASPLADGLGLHSSELFVEKTMPKSPAEAAGLKAGDRMVAIGDQQFFSFFSLKDAVQRAGESSGKVHVKWERDGQLMTADITPTATPGRDPLLKKTTQFTVGFVPMLVWAEPATITERIWNPFTLLIKGTERMAIFSYRNVVTLAKMVTGDVSVATLGGPILIGKLAGESLSRGLVSFLTMMAMLSVGLGVLNLLPVPVLDGGHLFLLGIEVVRGKPLTLRQMEIVQQVGLSLILLLMVVVMRNDLARLTVFN